MRYKIILFLVFVVFFSTLKIKAQHNRNMLEAEWNPLPLTTIAQKDAGIMGGEGGQVIFSMKYAPSNPNYVYLVTDTSRVWISKNGGVSWENKPNGFITKGGISLAIDPNNENIILVAGSVQTVSFTTGNFDGIYRSTDGGEHWTLVQETEFYRSFGQDNIFFLDSNIVYVVSHNAGVLKSNDGGLTWISLNILENMHLHQVFGDANTLIIGTENGLYSLTSDETLQLIGNGLPDNNIKAMAVSPANSNNVYIISNGSIYKSNDGGINFSISNNGLPNDKEFINLEISPVNPDYLYTSTEGQLWYSHDAGINWIRLTEIDAEGYMADIAQIYAKSSAWTGGSIIAPSPTESGTAIASGAGHYPIKTTDGGVHWYYSGSGFMGVRGDKGSTSFLWDINSPQRFGICATDFGFLLTEDGGQSFKNKRVPRLFGAKTSSVGAFDPDVNSERIIVATGNWQQKQIIVSTDNGENWIPKSGTSGVKMHPFAAFHPEETDNVYVGKFFSNDKGETWQELSRIVYGMYVGNGDIVYSMSLNESNHLTVYKSIDKGQTWTAPYGSITNYASGSIREIAIDPYDQDRIYVASEYKGIFIWNGTEWEVHGEESGIAKDAFGRYSCQKVVVDPNNTDILYLSKAAPAFGHSNGIFMSFDRGQYWENITGELGPDFNTTALSIDPYTSILYLGSSTGNYKYDSSVINTNTIEQDIFKIYPNPTDNIFTLDIGNEIIKSVCLYNSLGEFLERELTKTIDISNRSAGVYYVIITTQSDKKMINKVVKK